METEKCKLVGFFQTTGSPVCITEAQNLNLWQGAENENSTYQEMLDLIENELLLQMFKEKFLIFNTETGNFLIFQSNKCLIITEAIYMEENFTVPFQGINFEILQTFNINFESLGQLVIFDSSLTIELSNCIESLYKFGQSDYFDTAILTCKFDFINEVQFKNDDVFLSGIMLKNTNILNPELRIAKHL